jgi:hypothetical protein
MADAGYAIQNVVEALTILMEAHGAGALRSSDC